MQAPSADDISSQQSEHKEEPGPNTIENDGQMDDQSESYQVITGDIENDQAREEEEEKVSLVMAEQDTTSEMEGMFMPSATDGSAFYCSIVFFFCTIYGAVLYSQALN